MVKVTSTTLTTGGVLSAPVVEAGVISSVVDAIQYPLTMGASDLLDVSGVRYVAGTWAVAGLVIGSIVTRKKLTNNPDAAPTFGFLF
jgi:hypothetical protein